MDAEDSRYLYDAQREFVKEVIDGYFKIGQIYEDHPAISLECVTCGGKQFRVGVGSYFTAISCEKCGWSVCIHEG